ncbi:SapC family protein [Parasphingorhabdus halotolerans]|uniref:SapC family protein n=1 Tax=Parasphingorhabdus halotolerans TaxID=2725558 RepID=A0A6H2DNT1_9SPHN|nr:SapC family protein [Parasphingorhabdus halotolerans]QJB69411.1 SapC family protein [Parasphingorhabdus halotolerans]
MASAPQQQALPMFYKDLVPLNSNDHKKWKVKGFDNAAFMQSQHAIPITIDEFASAGRNYPIVFSTGENTVPLILMGLNEGVNTFMDDDGKFNQPAYVPAYVRRYPFLLAKLRPDADELSLCFDPTTEALGEYKEGDPLFDKDQPTDTTKGILEFCEQFEQAGQRTGQFMEELNKMDLLMEGEVSIQQTGVEKPYVYRGFKMVNEEKLRDLRGDELRKINQNGILPLIYSHLFSLQIMREVFAKQVEAGKVPQVTEAPAVPS